MACPGAVTQLALQPQEGQRDAVSEKAGLADLHAALCPSSLRGPGKALAGCPHLLNENNEIPAL